MNSISMYFDNVSDIVQSIKEMQIVNKNSGILAPSGWPMRVARKDCGPTR